MPFVIYHLTKKFINKIQSSTIENNVFETNKLIGEMVTAGAWSTARRI
jgi:hypothetical protein